MPDPHDDAVSTSGSTGSAAVPQADRGGEAREGLERRRVTPSFDARDVYVLGDTPRDIDCARAAGFVAVAIATGSYGTDELAAHKPDFLFADLSDTSGVIGDLLGS